MVLSLGTGQVLDLVLRVWGWDMGVVDYEVLTMLFTILLVV